MGFLTQSPDDDAQIQAMADGGTTELPGASGLDGLLSALPKGITEGAVKLNTLGNDVFAPVDNWMDANTPMLRAAPEHQLVSEANLKTIQQWAATGQDPRVTGGIGRIAAGTSEGLTIAGAGAAAGGPWGAATLLGSSEGYSDYLQNKADGLDQNTALEKAGVTAVASAASAFLPMKFGKTALQSVLGGAASNLMAGVASRAATSAVLRANGYDAMADQAKVFDEQTMLADTIMGAAFGAFGHYTHGAGGHAEAAPEAVNPADVDAAAATLVQNHLDRSAPGIPTDPEVANLNVDTMQQAIDALTNGRDVPTPSETDARTLLQGSLPDPAHDLAPTILDAAHKELPGFTDAVEPIKEVAPEPPVEGPGLEPLQPKAEGEPMPRPLDDMVQAQLDPLVRRYGDLQVTREDGSVAKLSDVAKEMQQQAADADRLAKAHEAAAACFIRTGGAA